MNALEKEVCLHIHRVAKDLHNRNLLAGNQGNVSVRLFEDYILITPQGVSKARMNPDDMAVIDSKGNHLVGKASSETSLHLAVYETCPEAKAVIHAHPPSCVAWSIARPSDTELPLDSIGEAILNFGRVPIVPYARPETGALGLSLKPLLPSAKAMILARHGALTWGDSLEQAHSRLEMLEQTSIILSQALRLGGLNPMPKAELEYLRARFEQESSKAT